MGAKWLVLLMGSIGEDIGLGKMEFVGVVELKEELETYMTKSKECAKFTSGPWIMTDMTDMVQAPHEKCLGHVYWIGPDEITSIAEVRAGSTDDSLPKQVKANAALIASAPELLEACQLALDEIVWKADTQKIDPATAQKVYDKLSGVVSKALGVK